METSQKWQKLQNRKGNSESLEFLLAMGLLIFEKKSVVTI